MSYIEIHSGRRFYPLNPAPSQIMITDIAHALSHQCRFSGHTSEFYSVAEHSVRVAELLEAQGADRETCLWGLLHDASEAFLVDVPMPLKVSEAFRGYRDAETRMQAAICDRFCLPRVEPEAVRKADRILLATEVRDLMPGMPDNWRALEEVPLKAEIVPWPSKVAKLKFVQRYLELAA